MNRVNMKLSTASGPRPRLPRRPVPRTSPGAPKMPAGLSAAAQRQWRELLPIMLASDLLTESDGPALAMLCELQARYRELRERTNREGMFVKIGGVSRLHPAARELNRLFNPLLRSINHFGLSPLSRARITRYGH